MSRGRPRKNIVGLKFRLLTVECVSEMIGHKGEHLLKCICECGKIKYATTSQLTRGILWHCGDKIHWRRRGESRSRIYGIWAGMMARCTSKIAISYPNYGGRGVVVSEDFKDFYKFKKWALSNNYSEHLTLDRINNDGNYCAENCRWVTMKENQRNKRNSILLTVDGVTKPLREWAEIYNIHRSTIEKRIIYGWDVKNAVTQPVGLLRLKNRVK